MQTSLSFMHADRVVMVYRLPLNEIVEDFFDAVKSATSGCVMNRSLPQNMHGAI